MRRVVSLHLSPHNFGLKSFVYWGIQYINYFVNSFLMLVLEPKLFGFGGRGQ